MNIDNIFDADTNDANTTNEDTTMTTDTTNTKETVAMKTARISLNSQTKKHPITLSNLGYAGKVDGESILVQVTGFVPVLDLTNGPEALIQLIADKKALTYGSKVILPGGVTKKGMNIFSMKELNKEPIVGKLRAKLGLAADKFVDFSALVMNEGEKKPKEKAVSTVKLPDGWG